MEHYTCCKKCAKAKADREGLGPQLDSHTAYSTYSIQHEGPRPISYDYTKEAEHTFDIRSVFSYEISVEATVEFKVLFEAVDQVAGGRSCVYGEYLTSVNVSCRLTHCKGDHIYN